MPNKNELRTRETRDLLLRAAETVFVREGYERAELGEIAALAGRTKGAIYGQFKSKEDLFIALFAARTKVHSEQMYDRLNLSTSIEQNLAILRDFYLETLEEKSWYLLLLEFKLFTLRHPDSKERLQQAHRELHPRYREEELVKVFGSEAEGEGKLDRGPAIALLSPILSAMAIEGQFTHSLLDDQTQKKIVTRLFDALFALPKL